MFFIWISTEVFTIYFLYFIGECDRISHLLYLGSVPTINLSLKLSPVHAPASTTVCMLGDAFITSFCTGHVAAPNKSQHVAVCFSTGRLNLWRSASLRSVLMHGVEASPCHLHCLGLKHPYVCLHRERRSPWARLSRPWGRHVVVCLP